MERAHVLVRLGNGCTPSQALVGEVSSSQRPGIRRTSAATVRLEHSDMSPGVASISFERVFDAQQSPAELFRESLEPAADAAVAGRAVSIVFSGARQAGKSFLCHGDADSRLPGDEKKKKNLGEGKAHGGWSRSGDARYSTGFSPA